MHGSMPKGHPHEVPGMKGGHGHGHPGGHPGGHGGGHNQNDKSGGRKWLPKLIAWELTRSCNLDCIHCRAAARFGPYPNELTTEECFKFLDDVASFSNPIMIMTGGEPMLRDDIWDIAKYGTKLGLRMVMAPCGFLVTEETARKMIESGIQRVSFSIDGATAESHDNFRRVPGAFASVMTAIENVKKVGLPFQVNTTITRHNLAELPKILELVISLGAVAHHPFLLVPTGRGAQLKDQEISPEEYEKSLSWFYEMRDRVPLQFKPTCAPHYYRIFRQKEREKGVTVTPETHGLDAMSKGCMGGQSFAFVSNTGKVQICGFLDVECGDIRKEPFHVVWDNSKVFQEMRAWDDYNGRCGYCEFRKVCGGCRARAFAFTGDYMDEEPFCTYQPSDAAKKAHAERHGEKV
ncbi:MAG: heme b synthase [Thermodesulfobacteriota bacterium]|nr:MAG: heme b synthase [Thermodesulfobacteriota bacterium]